MSTIEVAVRRHGATALALALLLAAGMAAHAAEEHSESALSRHAKSFGATVKRDTKTAAAQVKEGAHRVATAAKAVGHEIAGAARRSAAETRAAFKGEKGAAPAG